MAISGALKAAPSKLLRRQLALAAIATFGAGSIFAALRFGGELKKLNPEAYDEVVFSASIYTGFMGVWFFVWFVIWPRIRHRLKR